MIQNQAEDTVGLTPVKDDSAVAGHLARRTPRNADRNCCREATPDLRTRSPAIDAIKAIAILGVLTIHVSAGGYAYPIASLNWMSSAFFGSLTRASVPLFLMCSGALMLNPARDYPMKKLFGRNLLRLLFALLFWAFFYQLFHLYALGGFSLSSILEAAKHTLLFHHEPHLYYLHIMLLVYLFLPVTRVFVAAANRRQLEYLLLLWLLFGIVFPTAKHFWPLTLLQGIPLQYEINMTYAAIGYGIAGNYLLRYPLKKAAWNGLLFFSGLALVFGGTIAASLAQGSLYQLFFAGMSPGVALMAIGLFGFFSRLHYSPAMAQRVKKLSRASFCLYLVHPFFLICLNACGLTVACLPTLLSIPLLVAAIFLCSLLLYLLLSRLPLVRDYLI